MSGPIRVGVVGVGEMGERHARTFSEMPGAELVGVADPDAERAAGVAARHSVTPMGFDDLLDRVHAVSIASPTLTHADVALRAIEHGCHLLVEKPLATTLEEAGMLLDAANQRPRVVFMVGHIERFNPTVMALQSLIDGRAIRGLKFTRTSTFDRREVGRDIVYDLMIHDIDLALELLGEEIESIDASGDSIVTEQIDCAEAELRMKGDLPVSFLASRVAAKEVRSIEVRTDDETITADLLGMGLSIEPHIPSRMAPVCPVVGSDDPLRLELEHFVRCVSAGTRPVVGIDAGYRSMVMATTISSLIQRTRAARHDRRLVPAAL